MPHVSIAALEGCRDLPGAVDVRTRGAIGVVEFERRVGTLDLSARFVEAGVWIRPMGRVGGDITRRSRFSRAPRVRAA
jgi:adenosylmethionine-8-amino-7-oxononanoate aminotransferase